ncbi:MAG: FMN-binding protein [Intestinibacillus sp.]
MTLILSLALAAVLVAVGRSFLKKHSNVCYVATAVISLAIIGCSTTGVAGSFPAWFQFAVWPMFTRAGLATALFIVVMYAGALPNTSPLIRILMPIRAELSIVACILTLVHNVIYGQTYFRFLFTQPSRLPANQLMASVCSVIMLCVMLPLLVTSFPAIRRKMKAKSWKRLQRSAYLFYALIYVHVLLMMVPGARDGRAGYLSSIVVYSVVFLGYAAMRVAKALRNRHMALRRAPLGVAACVFVLVIGLSLHTGGASAAMQQVLSSDEETAADGQEQTGRTGQTSAVLTQQAVQTPASAAEQQSQPAAAHQSARETETAQTTVPVTEAEKSAQGADTDSKAKSSTDAVSYQYKNGSFTGSGDGFRGPISASVTLENDVIKSIQVTSSSDDEPYFTNGKAVIDRILSAQSTGVDAVSGATFSSVGIIDAVGAALSSAKN